jgi:hypothetical protein
VPMIGQQVGHTGPVRKGTWCAQSVATSLSSFLSLTEGTYGSGTSRSSEAFRPKPLFSDEKTEAHCG